MNMIRRKINRRRFITISAATGLVLLDPARISAANKPEIIRWQGSALGAKAQIMLYSDDPAGAQEIFRDCQQEIDRLENIFSLYRENSALSRLNRAGHLDNPPFEFLELMSRCLSCYRITGGAFDVTIQPLWKLYADYFSKSGADPAGPAAGDIDRVLRLVGSDKVIVESGRISFRLPGMGISLNGVAQGYITDRISRILRDGGLTNILVHMGETYASGHHNDGRPWTAGISSPLKDRKILRHVPLRDMALATSGGYGSPFSDQSQLHHLLDPKTGRSADYYGAVSVLAKDATTADMLSTALYVMAPDRIAGVWPEYPTLEKTIFVTPTGKITEYPRT